MKCEKCGFELPEDSIYCVNCGAAAPNAKPVSLNPAADIVLSALKDKLFFVVCILMSANLVFMLISGSIPIIQILATIYLWLIYSKATKGYADPDHLRGLSGTVYAGYIINNVASIMLIVLGALASLLFAVMGEEIAAVFDEAYQEILAMDLGVELPELSKETFLSFVLAIGIAFVLVGVAALLINLLGMRKIHRFVKSVYQGILTQNTEFCKPGAAKGWLMFFAIGSGLSAISSIKDSVISAISSAITAAVLIIAITLIDKYFIYKEN